MTDQLIDRLRHQAESEPVPELDLTGLVDRGRRLRRRRSIAQRTVATLAVGAVVGTAFALVRGAGGDPGLQVTTSISTADVKLVSAAYRTGGAFSRGHTLWFSDPDYSVDLSATIQVLYYTADGVVAGVTNDDDGDAKRDYVYVGTNGSVRPLHLPGDVVPGADAQADRFAYVTKAWNGYRIHVVEASTGRELATRSLHARYTWAGWDVPPIGLTGDYVVLGVDHDQQVLNWRTGARAADVPGEQLPSVGGGRALGGSLGAVTYRLGDSAPLRSTEELEVPAALGHEPWASNELSPDGRFVQTTTTFVMLDDKGKVVDVTDGATGERVRHPVVHVTDVATGRRITLPGNSRTYGWTPDGRLMRVDGTTVTTCDGDSGRCTTRTVPSGKGRLKMAGRYFGS